MNKLNSSLLNVIGLLFIYVLIADRFDLSLLFKDTILTGGDSASWYQVAVHMRDTLLPNGRLFGWSQDNFFGYSNLQHYFVFPFLLVVALGKIIPLTIALKVVSFSGILATPLAVFWTFRKLKYSDPIPLVAAWASMYFLFHEHFSIFGGNAQSTLAGEFCFSIAFALFILFIGHFNTGIQRQQRHVSNGLLLALIGLSHAFVFFSAALLPLYYLFDKQQLKKNLSYLIVVYGLAFLIMAFWSLPMLADRPYTAPITMIWNFYSWNQFADELGWFTVIMSFIAIVVAFIPRLQGKNTRLYLYMMLSSVFLYLIATSLKIPDIRFFPVWLFFATLLAVDLVAQLINQSANIRYSKILAVLSAILIGGANLYATDHGAPHWFSVNYGGYELTPAFRDGTLEDIVDILKGDPELGRIAFEHVDNTREFGSDRFFENLPLFTGRYTTEGIHYASGFLSKTITAMTGEYSLRSGGAEPIILSHPDVERLRDHFELFNISQIIVKSSEIEQMLRNSEDFKLIGLTHDYSIFELTDYQPNFVQALDYVPPLATIEASNVDTATRNWFRRSGKISELFIYRNDVEQSYRQELFNEQSRLNAYGELNPPSKHDRSVEKVSSEHIENLKISFSTQHLGKPHLIKIAYSPNWQSRHGEPIFRVAPGLMLIFPSTAEVEIEFTRSPWEWFGLLLTLVGLGLIVASIKNKQLFSRIQSSHLITAICVTAFRIRFLLLGLTLLLIIMLVVVSFQQKQVIAKDYRLASQLMNTKRYQQAIAHYQAIAAPENIAQYDRDEIPHALLALAQAQQQLDRPDLAYRALSELLQAYPSWKMIDVAYELLAELEYKKGNLEKAKQYVQQCERLTSYSQYKRSCEIDSKSIKDGR